MSGAAGRRRVVVVGGGFGGLGAAKKLAGEDDVRVTLVDRHSYHLFQPLLYQVATSQLAGADIAYPLRKLFHRDENVDVKMAEVAAIDPATRTITATDGATWTADAIVLGAGSQPNFFHTAGAEENTFPLYSLSDAQRLRSRVIGVFEDADRDPSRIDQGALRFVIVGGGPTGVELAGALADMIHDTMTAEFHDLAVSAAEVHIVDLGHALLGPFSEHAHDYVAKILHRKGVHVHLGVAVTDVTPDHVILSNGMKLATRCVIWGGGIKAPSLAAAAGLPQGQGGRIDVAHDLSVEGFPGIYVTGDIANILGPTTVRSRSWARSRCRAEPGRRATSSPTSRARAGPRFTTGTRASWP